eukprot:scaffold329771_cov61-Tisochrysis_lutea.AAC.2
MMGTEPKRQQDGHGASPPPQARQHVVPIKEQSATAAGIRGVAYSWSGATQCVLERRVSISGEWARVTI